MPPLLRPRTAQIGHVPGSSLTITHFRLDRSTKKEHKGCCVACNSNQTWLLGDNTLCTAHMNTR